MNASTRVDTTPEPSNAPPPRLTHPGAAAAAFLIGLVVFTVGVMASPYMHHRTVSTQGAVTQVHRHTGGLPPTCEEVVTYRADTTVGTATSLGTAFGCRPPGAPVTVMYDPANVTSATVSDGMTGRGWLVAALAGVSLFTVGTFLANRPD